MNYCAVVLLLLISFFDTNLGASTFTLCCECHPKQVTEKAVLIQIQDKQFEKVAYALNDPAYTPGALVINCFKMNPVLASEVLRISNIKTYSKTIEIFIKYNIVNSNEVTFEKSDTNCVNIN